jgi:hypothetical protein
MVYHETSPESLDSILTAGIKRTSRGTKGGDEVIFCLIVYACSPMAEYIYYPYRQKAIVVKRMHSIVKLTTGICSRCSCDFEPAAPLGRLVTVLVRCLTDEAVLFLVTIAAPYFVTEIVLLCSANGALTVSRPLASFAIL